MKIQLVTASENNVGVDLFTETHLQKTCLGKKLVLNLLLEEGMQCCKPKQQTTHE